MSIDEETPLISNFNSLEQGHVAAEPAVKKVARRGRPPKKIVAEERPAEVPAEERPEGRASGAMEWEPRRFDSGVEQKVRKREPRQEVFSFAPEDAELPSNVRESRERGGEEEESERSFEKPEKPERQEPSEEGGRTRERPRFTNNRRYDFPNKQYGQHQRYQHSGPHNQQQRQGGGYNQGGRQQHHQHQHQHQHHQHQQQRQSQHLQQQGQHSQQQQQQQRKQQGVGQQKLKGARGGALDVGGLVIGTLPQYELFKNREGLSALADEISENKEAVYFNEFYELALQQLVEKVSEIGIESEGIPHKRTLLMQVLNWAKEQKRPIIIKGIVELLDNNGIVVYASNNYAIKDFSAFISEAMMKEYGLLRGHEVEVQVHPPREGETCPFVVRLNKVMGMEPSEVARKVPFEDLVPYYPTRRLLLETGPEATWDNFSMRVVDILAPIGLGQRGLIVAPPRTGKTILLQGIAHAIAVNQPDAHLIVLLIDERPEEVTDFRRQVKGEVISSTFDEAALSHVHAAEMVIEKARRMVEYGRDVIILLDSITRLARAYNTMMPSSGKILSGGVEANALQKPKRFFGSARNIENGGSLTILGTALIDTGSRMDEVIFEEFKGTGNMELHLDRELVSKRIFPALSMDKSGTRKEELIYHPDEIEKVYSLRRAMKGVPPVEAMEMLIQRIKKTKSNTEFLLGLNR